MKNKLNLFSNYVLELNSEARERDVGSLLGWSAHTLSDILGFDSAWYGWAQIDANGPIIHASTTLNLPGHYYDYWTGISEQDLLVEQFLKNTRSTPTYDRHGRSQTDGMQGLSDAYGLKKMTMAMALRPGRAASLWMSVYRGGEAARAWTQEECAFLQCVIDHTADAARRVALRDEKAVDADASSILVNDQGVAIFGVNSVRERFGHIWSRHDGDRLPPFLTEYIDQPGEHILIDRGLVAVCEKAHSDMAFGLQKLTLRPLRKFDLLTPRERDVARVLASGKSHKETARILGVAPSTVRNHTQAIYAKLGVDNRANLAASVPRVPHATEGLDAGLTRHA